MTLAFRTTSQSSICLNSIPSGSFTSSTNLQNSISQMKIYPKSFKKITKKISFYRYQNLSEVYSSFLIRVRLSLTTLRALQVAIKTNFLSSFSKSLWEVKIKY